MTIAVTTPLQTKKNLSYRIISGIMLAMGLLISILMLVFHLSNNLLEHELLENQSLAELEQLKKELSINPDYQLPQTATLQIYLPDSHKLQLPVEFLSLPPGFNDEIETEQATYFVLVSEINDQPVYIVNDISEFERSEKAFEGIIVISWAILMALIFTISYLLSRQLLKPISDFADELDLLQPEQRGLKLSGRYHGLEIEKMTRSFDRYLNKMDEYVERQRSFSAMASHELRTPLTIVQTSAELISSQSPNEFIQSQCEKINRSTTSMSNLIMALLAITRDQPQQENDSDISLLNVVQDTLHSRHNDIKLNQINIENRINPQASINSNLSLLSVVVNNLLSNAIKHCPQGMIQIDYKNHRLCVQDNGTGLDIDDIDQLFKFGVAGKHNGGYGLGLYITRLICNHQGWQLELENANPGTRACVTFLSN